MKEQLITRDQLMEFIRHEDFEDTLYTLSQDDKEEAIITMAQSVNDDFAMMIEASVSRYHQNYEEKITKRKNNFINITWCVDDILERDIHNCEDSEENLLTEEQAYKVLKMLDRNHDAEVGINWDFIDFWIDEVKNNN